MKKIFLVLSFGFVAFLSGGLAVFAAMKYKPQLFMTTYTVEEAAAPDVAPQRLPEPKDHFAQMEEQMKRMRQQMHQQMEQDFFDPKVESSANVEGISQREDDKFVYIDIKVEDPQSTTLKTKVENGYITVEGKSAKNAEGSSFESSFHQSFPAPENVDTGKMEMTAEEGQFVLKLPKIKS